MDPPDSADPAGRSTKTIGHARSGCCRRALDGEFDSPPSPPTRFSGAVGPRDLVRAWSAIGPFSEPRPR